MNDPVHEKKKRDLMTAPMYAEIPTDRLLDLPAMLPQLEKAKISVAEIRRKIIERNEALLATNPFNARDAAREIAAERAAETNKLFDGEATR